MDDCGSRPCQCTFVRPLHIWRDDGPWFIPRTIMEVSSGRETRRESSMAGPPRPSRESTKTRKRSRRCASQQGVEISSCRNVPLLCNVVFDLSFPQAGAQPARRRLVMVNKAGQVNKRSSATGRRQVGNPEVPPCSTQLQWYACCTTSVAWVPQVGLHLRDASGRLWGGGCV